MACFRASEATTALGCARCVIEGGNDDGGGGATRDRLFPGHGVANIRRCARYLSTLTAYEAHFSTVTSVQKLGPQVIAMA